MAERQRKNARRTKAKEGARQDEERGGSEEDKDRDKDKDGKQFEEQVGKAAKDVVHQQRQVQGHSREDFEKR